MFLAFLVGNDASAVEDNLFEDHIGKSTSITAKIITKESDMVLSSDGGEQVRTTLKVKYTHLWT